MLYRLYKAGELGASLPVTSSILKGDGSGGAAAATAGTDYPGLASANQWTGSYNKGAMWICGPAGNDFRTEIHGDHISLGTPGRLTFAPSVGYAYEGTIYYLADVGMLRAAAGFIRVDGASVGGGGGLELEQVSGGGTPSTNTARIYAKDNGGTAEIYVKDEAGNETQISPHAANMPFAPDLSDPFPHVVHERNAYVGVERFINVSRMAYLLQALFPHERIVVERDLPKSEWLDWDAVQAEHQARYNAERAAEIEAREKAIRQAAIGRRASIILNHMRAEAQAAGCPQAEIDKLDLAPEIIAELEPLAADLEAARAEIPNRVRPVADIRKPAPAWLQPRMRDDYDNTRKPKLNWKQRLLAWLMK